MQRYNQIRAMLAISRASLRSIFRSPSAVVFSLVFPLVFILVFGFIGGEGPGKIDISVAPGSDTANAFYKELKSPSIQKGMDTMSNPFRVHAVKDEAENQLFLQQGTVDASISLHLRQDSGYVQIIASITALPNNMQKAAQLSEFVTRFNSRQYLLARYPHLNMATVAVPEVKASQVREYKTIDFILPGQLGFSLLSTGVFGTAFVFLSLRQTLVIKRFFATPISRPYIVVGEALSRVLFGMMGAVVIILLGNLMFGFTLVHGIFTLLQMLLLCLLGLAVFMGFGFVVSGIAKNESSVPPLANLITLPQFLLSGTFFSTSNFPGWLQPISNALPLTYMNHAMRKIAFEGASLLDVWKDVGIMCLWGVVVYALAVKVFRWE